MEQSYWEVTDEKEIWLRTIGLEKESEKETVATVATITHGIELGGRCLEIGAGVGRLLRRMATHFGTVVGIDYSAALCQRSVDYLHGTQARVVRTNGLTIPFPDNYFNFIYSYTVFHHMPEVTVRANLREAYRVLAPGGYCRIQTLLGDRDAHVYDGYVFKTDNECKEEFRSAGFTNVTTELRQEPRDRDCARLWVTARKLS